MEAALMKESNMAMVEGLPYIAVFRAFNKVVESCFGMQLATDYKKCISNFSFLYRELGISVTPKVRFNLLRIIQNILSIGPYGGEAYSRFPESEG